MKDVRLARLQKEMLKIISSVFQGDISDPRLSGLKITKIKMTRDLKKMKIYFAEFDKKLTDAEIVELLTRSSGFLKKQIAGARIMRTIPDIVYEYDKTNERVEKIEELFQKIAEEKRNSNYYDDDNDNDYYDNDGELLDEDLEDYEEYQDDLNDEDLEFEYEDIDDDDEEM
ncbi:MAG: 30S ribosome-binding factor RbfA [Candidatus Cloacimonetes bacterium]|nr:30S ribosome-binding factor RbfA [Candidatus Cloacimonadota bacterium]